MPLHRPATRSKARSLFFSVALAVAWVGGGAEVIDMRARALPVTEKEDAELSRPGAFTCDFTIPGSYPFTQVAPDIERDRMYMAARPGMQHKHIPMAFTNTGDLLSGGRYLFDTQREARHYLTWIQTRFELDGMLFFDRPIFVAPDCHAWESIQAEDFADFRTSQVVFRTERFAVGRANVRDRLAALYPAIRAEALARGYTGLWLLYAKQDRLASVVYFADRVAPVAPGELDVVSYGALADAQPLGHPLEAEGWSRVFDRTSWTLTIWLPFMPGDRGEASIWPNSPPLPEPYAGDGVCEVSRGEDASNSLGDCPLTCGDGVADPGEDSHNCPGDVRLFD